MQIIENKTFDLERALYGSRELTVKNCRFEGPADGESAFKECRAIEVENCFFDLRYPFWHVGGLKISASEMTENCRAALWYSENIEITDTKLHGIKALRECCDVTIKNCDIISPEFGWSSKDVRIEDTAAKSEYFMLRAENIAFKNMNLCGKYSFQYIKNAVFENCRFDTKDAFWHGENITVKNSIVKGEYLAWYSIGLTFDHCKIIGTQPLCYCKDLRLIDCEMYDCDLAFERSEVEAEITTPVISVKNPLSGRIVLPKVEEIIMDIPEAKGEVIVTDTLI